MRLLAVTATTRVCPMWFPDSCKLGGRVPNTIYNNLPNIGLVGAYQYLYELRREDADVLMFMHDDVEVFTPEWGQHIEIMFEREPKLAIVGLGGATGIGVHDIYKTPYHITQLQRINYASNQRDWEIHGTHEVGIKDVAVVDGFFMAIRTKFLDEVDGWKWFPYSFHCYDTAMCLMAIRHRWKVKMVGLTCHHHGGGTSTSPTYEEWCRDHNTDMAREHSEPHRFMYEFFRPELPYEVPK